MPEPPDVGLVTRFVFENPWPVVIVLAGGGAVMAWMALRDGRLERVRVAAGLVGVGIVIAVIGAVVTTSGEHAEDVTRRLVDAAVTTNTAVAVRLLADDASLAIGSPDNPGFDVDYIRSQLEGLARRVVIDSNRITGLRAYSESSDAAVVHFGCWTEAGGFTSPSQWVVRVEKQSDGVWKVTRITCVSINQRVPDAKIFR